MEEIIKNWGDAASQLGAYSVFDNAKAMADKHPGYKVYDWNGKQMYPAVMSGGCRRNEQCRLSIYSEG